MPTYQASFDYSGKAPTLSFMRTFMENSGFTDFRSVSIVTWEIVTRQSEDTVYNVLNTEIENNGAYRGGKLESVNVERADVERVRGRAAASVAADEAEESEEECQPCRPAHASGSAAPAARTVAAVSSGAGVTASLFRDGASQRRLAAHAARESALLTTSDVNFDQKPWGLLYGALQAGLGVDPGNFQMVYPFTTWDWPTQSVGFIGSAQYDFCSTIPLWSAIGSYTSSGDRFNQAYQEFLNVIPAATDDPELRRKIAEQEDVLTQASNDYTTAYNQAVSAYNDDPNVVDNVPSFSLWLGSPAGKGWAVKIGAADVKLTQAQKNYDALVDQANTPGLADAQAQFANKDFYAKLNDPGLSTFPKVPYWSIPQTARQWVDKIKAGEGPAGGTIGFNNREQAYDYSKTWAGGTAAIQQFFWSVKINGQWERVQQFESDQELNVSVEFEAQDIISIQPSDWYNGSFVDARANGPFKRGYSAFGGNGTQAIFGQKGFMGLLKTAMFVCYKPTFMITTSKSTFNSFVETFKAATALRIGPFTFSASGGSTRSGWEASEAGQSFSGTSSSETPLIFGVSIAEPGPGSGTNERLTAAAVESVGNCYRFGDCRGDVLGTRVTKSECFNYLQGQSWKKDGTTRCWEN